MIQKILLMAISFVMLNTAASSGAEGPQKTNEIPDPTGMMMTLRTISMAAQAYASDNKVYPAQITDLTEGNQAYLSKEYCHETVWGYTYDCVFSASGYELTATPLSDAADGPPILTIKTGGILQTRVPQPLRTAANAAVDFFSSPRDFWELSQIQKYERFLKIDPNNNQLRLVLADLYLGHGNGETACALAETVIASHPDLATAQKAYHTVVLGYYVAGDLKRSYEKNKEDLQFFPTDETARCLQRLLESILKQKSVRNPTDETATSNLSLHQE